jgi:hypothetical protein
MNLFVKASRLPRPPLALVVAALAALGIGACGNLDDITTVHDLRVLAAKSEPAGFLVPLDKPDSLTNTTATITALVVDPQRPNDILTLTAQACPDDLDTITAASGQSTKLCASRDVTDKLPAPLDTALATTDLPPGTATPSASSPIEYDPMVVYGFSPAQLGLFFSPTPTNNPVLDQSIQYNRDFGLDAIVNPTFTLGTETASAIKRVVYWPLLPPDLAQVGPALDGHDCPPTQTPNENPELMDIGLFRQRTDGVPTDPYPAGQTPTLSVATDKLYVQPTYDPSAAEYYRLRRKDARTGAVNTECDHETLTFQFFTTAGTFSPAERTSELPLFFDKGSRVPLDSQFEPPKGDTLPADGVVTIWVVTRDERAGASWMSRTIMLTP